VFPFENEAIPPHGNAENENIGSNVPTFPLIPPKKKENISEKKSDENSQDTKDLRRNDGNNGNSGNIDSIDRLVDSDFSSKVSVPNSVPTYKNIGNRSKKRIIPLRFLVDFAGYKKDEVVGIVTHGDLSERKDICALISCGQCPTAIKGSRPVCDPCSYLGKGRAEA
jgi:hypothetical protein